MRCYIRTRPFSWATGVSFQTKLTTREWKASTVEPHPELGSPFYCVHCLLRQHFRKHVHFPILPIFFPTRAYFPSGQEKGVACVSNAQSKERCLLTLLHRITSSSSSSSPSTNLPSHTRPSLGPKDVWPRQLRCSPCCGNNNLFLSLVLTRVIGKSRFDGAFD